MSRDATDTGQGQPSDTHLRAEIRSVAVLIGFKFACGGHAPENS